LRFFLEASLSKKQREIFLYCDQQSGDTFSSIVDSSPFPKSTSKYVMKQLKSFGLIDFGDINNKGKPLDITNLGATFVKILRGDEI
jgi:hypothetical protein